ncbi:MAG: hypothetical protein PVG51_10650 [Desulfosarcina sp.]
MEAEEILEMVNAGLVSMTVADNYLVELWSNLFTDMVTYPNLAVNRGGEIAWMIRKYSPKLKGELNAFIKGHQQRTLFGNIIINRYFKNTQWIRPIRCVSPSLHITLGRNGFSSFVWKRPNQVWILIFGSTRWKSLPPNALGGRLFNTSATFTSTTLPIEY